MLAILALQEAIHCSAESGGLATVHNPLRRVHLFCKVQLAEGGHHDSLLGFRWPMCNSFEKEGTHLISIL